MQKLLPFFVLFICTYTFSQVKDTIIDGKKVANYTETDKVAIFPKGTREFMKMIEQNFRVDQVKGNGKLSSELTFVVDIDGTITDIKAIGENAEFNQEAIHALKMITEKWIPAEINGQKVRYRFRVPLNLNFGETESIATYFLGNAYFEQLIQKNFRTRKVSGNGKQSCEITFTVTKSGAIKHIQATGNNESFNNEAINAVSKIKGRWNPAIKDGKRVDYFYKYPLSLTIE